MSSPGFPYAQLDSAFMGDPKFRSLRDAVPNATHYYAAVGAWITILADTWAAADRFAGTESAAGLPTGLVASLVRAGLIDDAHCIPEGPYMTWIGHALERRKDVAERVRRHRSMKAKVTPVRVTEPVTVSNVVEGEEEREGELSSKEEKKNGRDEVSAESYDRAWFSTLRDLYGPGGIFSGRPLPGKFNGKTWAEVEKERLA